MYGEGEHVPFESVTLQWAVEMTRTTMKRKQALLVIAAGCGAPWQPLHYSEHNYCIAGEWPLLATRVSGYIKECLW